MAWYQAKEKKVTYKVIENCGLIADRGKSKLELRLVSWNNAEPKYDIRPWWNGDNGEVSGKGVTLTTDEAKALYTILKGIAEEKPAKHPRVAGAKRSRK